MEQIIMPCPMCTKEHKFYPENWIHQGCGGYLYIDNNAMVHCKVCGKKSHITKMYMSCNHHRFIRPKKKQIISAIAASSMGNSSESERVNWLLKLLKHI